MQVSELVQGVEALTSPSEVEAVYTAARERLKLLRAQAATTLCKGQRVRFTTLLDKAELRGAEATVTKVNRRSVNVEIADNPAYGSYAGQEARVGVNYVEAI